MYQKAPISDRIARIRHKYRTTVPRVDIHRYKLVTEFYMENPDLTGILKRAYMLKHVFENMPTPPSWPPDIRTRDRPPARGPPSPRTKTPPPRRPFRPRSRSPSRNKTDPSPA